MCLVWIHIHVCLCFFCFISFMMTRFKKIDGAISLNDNVLTCPKSTYYQINHELSQYNQSSEHKYSVPYIRNIHVCLCVQVRSWGGFWGGWGCSFICVFVWVFFLGGWSLFLNSMIQLKIRS